jgi:hypothetical protein
MAKKHHGRSHHHTGPVHHPGEMHDHLPGVKDGHLHESHSKGLKEQDGAGGEIVGHQNYGHDGSHGCGGAMGSNEC